MWLSSPVLCHVSFQTMDLGDRNLVGDTTGMTWIALGRPRNSRFPTSQVKKKASASSSSQTEREELCQPLRHTLFAGDLYNSFRKVNTKFLSSSLCSDVIRHYPSSSILSDKIIHNLAVLVTTISDLTPNLFAFFVVEIAFLLTHQVRTDISLRFSVRFEILTYGQHHDPLCVWTCP